MLGGYNGARETIGQAITVPATGNLRYCWKMSSSDSTTARHDYLQVQVFNASTGAFISSLKLLSNIDARNVWTRDTISLAAYAGQTVRIQFTASLDSALTTSFAIDDVMTG